MIETMFDAKNLLVRSFSIVSPHMRSDGRRLGKSSIANVAMKWFFATVSSAMSGQIRGLRE